MPRINLRDLLEVIAQAEVIQRRRLENAGWSYAHTTTKPNKILIARDQTVRQKVDTLIHESIHLYYALHNIEHTEDQVIRQTRIIMRRLYRS